MERPSFAYVKSCFENMNERRWKRTKWEATATDCDIAIGVSNAFQCDNMCSPVAMHSHMQRVKCAKKKKKRLKKKNETYHSHFNLQISVLKTHFVVPWTSVEGISRRRTHCGDVNTPKNK